MPTDVQHRADVPTTEPLTSPQHLVCVDNVAHFLWMKSLCLILRSSHHYHERMAAPAFIIAVLGCHFWETYTAGSNMEHFTTQHEKHTKRTSSIVEGRPMETLTAAWWGRPLWLPGFYAKWGGGGISRTAGVCFDGTILKPYRKLHGY